MVKTERQSGRLAHTPNGPGQHAQLQRNAISRRDYYDLHSLVGRLPVELSACVRDDGGAWHVPRPRHDQPLGGSVSAQGGEGVPPPQASGRAESLANDNYAAYLLMRQNRQSCPCSFVRLSDRCRIEAAILRYCRSMQFLVIFRQGNQ